MHTDTMKECSFTAIQELLACPLCRGRLLATAENFFCPRCGKPFPIRDGIPLLAVLEEA